MGVGHHPVAIAHYKSSASEVEARAVRGVVGAYDGDGRFDAGDGFGDVCKCSGRECERKNGHQTVPRVTGSGQ